MKPQGTLIFEEEQHFNPVLTVFLPIGVVLAVVAIQVYIGATVSRAMESRDAGPVSGLRPSCSRSWCR